MREKVVGGGGEWEVGILYIADCNSTRNSHCVPSVSVCFASVALPFSLWFLLSSACRKSILIDLWLKCFRLQSACHAATLKCPAPSWNATGPSGAFDWQPSLGPSALSSSVWSRLRLWFLGHRRFPDSRNKRVPYPDTRLVTHKVALLIALE